eukprot:2200775-Lingulodinium_polyedra.AAC.1
METPMGSSLQRSLVYSGVQSTMEVQSASESDLQWSPICNGVSYRVETSLQWSRVRNGVCNGV